MSQKYGYTWLNIYQRFALVTVVNTVCLLKIVFLFIQRSNEGETQLKILLSVIPQFWLTLYSKRVIASRFNIIWIVKPLKPRFIYLFLSS